MNSPSAPIAVTAHLIVLSSISFGGFPTVLPDVRNFVVATHGWMTDQEFANFFAIAQSIPGPNMILMMSFVGWKVWGFPGAAASAFATFGPPCAIYFAAYRVWDRFRNAPWQRIVRLGLVPGNDGACHRQRHRNGACGGRRMAGRCRHYRRGCDHAYDTAQSAVAAPCRRCSGRPWPTVRDARRSGQRPAGPRHRSPWPA
jgi:hypothetical protein